MLPKKSLLLISYGILLVLTVSNALKGSRTKLKVATTSTTTTEAPEEEEDINEGDNIDEVSTIANEINGTTKRTLTGIPQIDYVWDPNLPRELNGYNLSEYPFYNSIPADIKFACDGLHDGFYASVPHKCQVYHHCLFGTRYDFLCANFTAFDQKNFICHFVSEVDCVNSKKYWYRNDVLYQAASTTTPSTTTTTTTTTLAPTTSKAQITTPTNQATEASIEGSRPFRRRRPYRRRPSYDYYEEEYYDDDYEQPRMRNNYERRNNHEYNDRTYMRERNRDRNQDFQDRDRDRNNRDRDISRREPARDYKDFGSNIPNERFSNRNTRKEFSSNARPIKDFERATVAAPSQEKRNEYDEEEAVVGSSDSSNKPLVLNTSVYSRPRIPSKIRRPVPLSEKERFAYKTTQLSTPEPRKLTTEPISSTPLMDDYDEDDIDDMPVRRPMRQRKPYRDYERNHRDRIYSTRDGEREVRPRRIQYNVKIGNEKSPTAYSDQSRDYPDIIHGNNNGSLSYNLNTEEQELILKTSSSLPSFVKETQEQESVDRPLISPNLNTSFVIQKTEHLPLSDEKTTKQKIQQIQYTINNNDNNNFNNYNNNNNNNNNDKDCPNHENNSSHYDYSDIIENAKQSQDNKNSDESLNESFIFDDQYVQRNNKRSGIKKTILPSRGRYNSPRGLCLVGRKANEQDNSIQLNRKKKESTLNFISFNESR